MTSIDRASQAFLGELHRQGKERGVTVEDNGELVQVDGSFEVRPLILAVLASLEKSGTGGDNATARIPGLNDARGSANSASSAAEAALRATSDTRDGT